MKFVFIISIIFVPLNALADLNECEGIWTNKSCSAEKKDGLLEAQTADPAKLKEQGQKKSLFHVLNMKSIKANNDYAVKLDLSSAEEACTDPDTSLENCRKLIKELDAILDEKINLAAELKTREKELKLQEEANRLQEERNKIEKNKPNVVVIQKRKIIIPRDYLKPKEKESSIKIESKGNDLKVDKDKNEEIKGKSTAASVK